VGPPVLMQIAQDRNRWRLMSKNVGAYVDVLCTEIWQKEEDFKFVAGAIYIV